MSYNCLIWNESGLSQENVREPITADPLNRATVASFMLRTSLCFQANVFKFNEKLYKQINELP